MRNVILVSLLLMMSASGCITLSMGGGAASQSPVVVSFTVSPSSIQQGEAAILSWEVKNASSVSIDPGLPAVATTGAEKVVPSTTTTYILTASNSAGSSRATALLTVSGSITTPPLPAAGLPVILSFTASPASISPGGSAVLSWTTSNATGASISGIGAVGTSGVTSVSPSMTTTYVLEATNGTNTVTAMTSVAVSGGSTPYPGYSSRPAILVFTASPSVVAAGGSTVLSWDVSNATSVDLLEYGPVSSSGSMNIYPSGTGTITFHLSAQNAAGTSNASTTVTISGSSSPTPGSRPGIVAFSVTPSTIPSGSSATLSWDIYNATSVQIDNGIGVVGSSGSVIVSPAATTTYHLIAQNAYGTTYASCDLTVTPPAVPYTPPAWPIVNKFKASDSTVLAGSTVLLSWSVSDADSVYIDNGIGSVPAVGSANVVVWSTTVYTLVATNGANTVAQPVTVTVP